MNLLSRGRARLRVCLLVLTVCLAGAAFTAPTASATNFAVLFGGTQGGSDQDGTLYWSNVAAVHAANISFFFAAYWPHMHKVQRECSRAQALTSACPTASRIATVAATFSEPGSILPVVRTGYLALERKRSGELAGHDVLLILDQNSRYARYVGRRRVEVLKSNKQGDPNANTRIDLGAPPELVTRSGATSQARMTSLSIVTQKQWMRLPTSCDGGSSVSAVTTLADGSSETVVRSPSVTGCGSLTVDSPLSVMFNPREYTIDKSVPWKVSGRIGDHADGERVTDPRTVRMKMMGAPKIGEATAVFNVVCTPAQADIAGCPADSRLGEFCVESSPAGETACGDVWNAGVRPPGSGGGGAGGSIGLLLSLTKYSSGGGGGAGGLLWVSDGSVEIVPGTGESILTINNLPQADLHGFRMSGDNPLFEANGNCGTNPLYESVTGWNGAIREATGVSAIACSPGIETTDAASEDADGDGIADKIWQPANFKVNFRVTDTGGGIDESSIACRHRGWDGTVKGSTKVDDLDGDGRADVCVVTDSPAGPSVLEIRAADRDGHVTVLKRGFTVDSQGPVARTTAPIDDDADGDGMADDPYRDSDFELWFDTYDEGSGIDDDATTCGAEDLKGIPLPKVTPKIAKEHHGRFRCIVEGADDGPLVLVATVRDLAGNVVLLRRGFTVDTQGPVIKTTQPKDDDCDGRSDDVALSCFRPAFFDVFYSAEDAGSGVDWTTNTCAVRMLGGALPGGAILSARVVDLDSDGRPDACRVENAPDGEIEVSISAADGGGHVTVLKRSYQVKSGITNVVAGFGEVEFALGRTYSLHLEVGDPLLALVRCGVATGAGAAAGAARCADSSCQSVGDLEGDGLLDFVCEVVDLDQGHHPIEIVITDTLGNAATLIVDVYRDVDPPEVAPTDTADEDSDGDGFADSRWRPAFFDITYRIDDDSFFDDTARVRAYDTGECRAKARGRGTVATGRIETGFAGEATCFFEGLPDDDYDVTFEITDVAGNRASHTVGVTVDTTAPTVGILSPADGSWVACPADDAAATGVVPIRYTVADSSGDLSEVSLRFANGPRQTVSYDPGSPIQTEDMNIDCREMTTGLDVEYRVTAVDPAGNVGEAPAHLLIDRSPPVIVMTNPLDADHNGDGEADQPYRDSDFGIWFDTYDEGSGIAESGIACDAETADGVAIRGKVKTVRDNGSGYLCELEGLPDGPVRVTLTAPDIAGHRVTSWRGFEVDAQGPTIRLTNYLDADDDGDGWADRPWRPAFFDVFYNATDDGSGVDWVSNTCAVRMLGGAVPGGAVLSARTVDLDDDGRPDACRIEGAPDGDAEVSISVADHRGHVTVLKLSVTVDTTPPAIAIDEPGVHITGDPDFDLWTDLVVTIDGKTDATDLAGYSCVIIHEGDLDGDGEFEPLSRTATGCGGGGSGGTLRVLPTVNKITLEVGDPAGNKSSQSVLVYLDIEAPSIAIDEPGVHITGDPDFDLLIAIDDDSLDVDGPLSATCARKGWDGTIKGNLKTSKADAGRALDGVCAFTDVADGDYEVELTVTDAGGHVTVLKHSMTVDTTAPSIAIDEPGVHLTSNPVLDVFAEIGHTIDGIRGHRDVGGYRCATFLNGDYDGVSRPTSNCAPAGELGGPPPLQLSPGSNHVTLVVEDPAGNVSTAFFDVFFNTAPPRIVPNQDGITDHFVSEPSFGIGFTAVSATFTVASNEASTICWMFSGADSTVRVDGRVILFGGLDDTREFSCEFDNVSDGTYQFHLVVTDATGLESSYSRPITVDTIDPEVTIAALDGNPFERWPPVYFSVDDANPGHSVCSVIDLATGAAVGEDEDCDGYADSAGQPCDPDDPAGPGTCRRTFVMPHIIESSGRYRATVVHTDQAGNTGSASIDFTLDTEGPVVATADPIDDDCDGRADDAPVCYRQAFFDVFFTAIDEGSGVDWSTASCRGIIGKKPTGGATGRLIDDDGDGVPEGCSFEGLEEEKYDVEISVADWRGHVTVLKLAYTIDSTPPVVRIIEPADADGDGWLDQPVQGSETEILFEIADGDSGIDPDSVYCSAEHLSAGLPKITPKISKESHGQYRCSFGHEVPSQVTVLMGGRDTAGNEGVEQVSFDAVAEMPVITLTDPRDDDSDGDGLADDPYRGSSFSVPFAVTNDPDHKIAQTAKCLVRGWNPEKKEPIVGVADTDGDGVPDACTVEQAVDADIKIEISAAGPKSVERSWVIDTTKPETAFFDPGSEPFDGRPPLRFSVADANPGTSICTLAEGETAEIVFIFQCSAYAGPTGEQCDPADPTTLDCERSFFIGAPSGLEPNGSYVATVTHTDRAGNSSSATFAYETDRPPRIEFSTSDLAPDYRFTIYDGDPNGDTSCYVLPEVGDEVLVAFACGGVWSGSTCDCVATLPATLEPGRTYRLRVAHRRLDGGGTMLERAAKIDLNP